MKIFAPAPFFWGGGGGGSAHVSQDAFDDLRIVTSNFRCCQCGGSYLEHGLFKSHFTQ